MTTKQYRGVVREFDPAKKWSQIEELTTADGTQAAELPFEEVRINHDLREDGGSHAVQGPDEQIIFELRPITGDDGPAAADLHPSNAEGIAIAKKAQYVGTAPKPSATF